MALYESTGEVRVPLAGELYLSSSHKEFRKVQKLVVKC